MRITITIVAGLLAFAGTTSAQNPPSNDSLSFFIGPEIVVTATRLPTARSQVASAMSVLTAEEIAAAQQAAIADLLRNVAGLDIAQAGGPGRTASAFLRGANPDHTLVLVDGVEANDPGAPGNAYDLGGLYFNNLGRIEVLRGPQSTLYGSNAIGGVINIMTRPAGPGFRGSIRTEAGAFGTRTAAGSLQHGSERLSFVANGRLFHSDGISASDAANGNSETDAYTNAAFSAKLRAELSGAADLLISGTYSDADGDLDKDGLLGDDPNYRFHAIQRGARAELRSRHADGRFSQSLSASVGSHSRSTGDSPDAARPSDSSASENLARRLKLSWLGTLAPNANQRLSLGANIESERSSSMFSSESTFGGFQSVFPERSVRTGSLYGQHHSSLGANAWLTTGIRYDDHETFGGKWTFRVAPVYNVTRTGTRLTATLGTGFNAPTLFEIYDPAFGNLELRPEKSLGWDIGLEQSEILPGLTAGVTYFKNTFEDLIGFDANFRAVNIDEAASHGIEFQAVLQRRGGYSLRADYTWTRTEDRSAGAEDGARLLRRPEHKVALHASAPLGSRLTARISILYTGARDDLDFSAFPAARVSLEQYLLVNAAGSFNLGQGVRLTARAENIFDAEYQEILFFGAAGRALYAGFAAGF